jgi:predicted phage replisome organizer
VIFYLQLLCESLSHNGKLRFNEEIPYSEEMLSVITDTNIDVVRSAMKLFEQLKIIEIMDDQTIYMTKLQNMVGSTTIGAEKKMLQREKSTQLLGGGQKVDICPPEIDIEKEIELDKEINIVSKQVSNLKKEEETNIRTCESYDELLEDFGVFGEYRNAVFRFIAHLKVSFGIVMLNDRLENLIIKLDRTCDEDLDKVKAIDDAIVKGYKKLECE